MILQFATGVLIPKLVSPVNYGLWRSLMIIYQYATFSNSGTYAAIGVKMPYYNGKGDLVERDNIKNNTFYFNVFISTVISAILIISSFYTFGENQQFYKYGFLLFSILTFSSNIADFFLQLFRIEKNFLTLSKLTVLQIVSQLILSILFITVFKDILFLSIAIIVSNFILIFFALLNTGIPKFVNIKFSEMWKLILFGFPLLLNGILLEIIRGIDQVLIISFLNPEDLGYYGLAVAIQRIGFLVPGVLASILMPYIYEEYGKTNNIKRISQIYEKSIIIVALICAFFLVNMIIYSELLIKYFLPKYLNSLNILKILLVGMFSIGLLGLPEILASITGRIVQIIKLQLGAILISFISISFIIYLGYGITGVALTSITIYFFYTLGILYITFKVYANKFSEIITKILLVYMPYFYLMMLFYFATNMDYYSNNAFWSELVFAILKSFLILLGFIPLLIYYNNKFSIFHNFISMSTFSQTIKFRKL